MDDIMGQNAVMINNVRLKRLDFVLLGTRGHWEVETVVIKKKLKLFYYNWANTGGGGLRRSATSSRVISCRDNNSIILLELVLLDEMIICHNNDSKIIVEIIHTHMTLLNNEASADVSLFIRIMRVLMIWQLLIEASLWQIMTEM